MGCRRYIAVARTAVLSDAQFHGDKYQSGRADWLVDPDRNAGFACLGFDMTRVQYFQYSYEATPSGFVALGHGDVNADGIKSEFT